MKAACMFQTSTRSRPPYPITIIKTKVVRVVYMRQQYLRLVSTVGVFCLEWSHSCSVQTIPEKSLAEPLQNPFNLFNHSLS